MKRTLHIFLAILVFGAVLESCHLKKKIQKPTESQSNEDFDSYFIDAVTHFNTTNYATALKLFNKCAAIKPEEASTYYYISRIKFEEQFNSEEGLQFAMKANRLAPKNVAYAQWYANKLKQFSQIDKAIEVLEICLSSNPKDEPLVNDLDALYARKGQTEKRIKLWNGLIETKGFSIKYALKLVELHRLNKDFASAHKVYEQIEAAAPKKYHYYVDDGNLYLNEGKKSEAFAKFDKALSINPNIWEVNQSLFKLYYQEKDTAKALKYLRQGLNDPTVSFQAKAYQITEITTRSQTDSSQKPYMEVVADALYKVYPGSADACKVSAYCYEYLGRYPQALRAYKTASALKSNYDAYKGLIRLQEKIYGPAVALPYVDSALEVYPTTPELYKSGADLAIKSGQYKKALEYAETGLSFAVFPEQKAELLALQAKAQLLNGQTQTAKTTCGNALTIYPDNPQLLECMGDILSNMGKAEEAKDYWKKALEKGGDANILNKKIREGKINE